MQHGLTDTVTSPDSGMSGDDDENDDVGDTHMSSPVQDMDIKTQNIGLIRNALYRAFAWVAEMR